MSVQNRQYELAANATRIFDNMPVPAQPTNLQEATDHILAAFAELDVLPDDMRHATAREMAEQMYDEDKDFALQLTLYEHDNRPADQQLPTEALTSAVLHRLQARRSSAAGERGRLAVALLTNETTHQRSLSVYEAPVVRQRVEITQ